MPPGATSQPDLVIRDALLIDGSGRPGVRGDLAVKDDRIVAIGDLSRASRAARDRRERPRAGAGLRRHPHP